MQYVAFTAFIVGAGISAAFAYRSSTWLARTLFVILMLLLLVLGVFLGPSTVEIVPETQSQMSRESDEASHGSNDDLP